MFSKAIALGATVVSLASLTTWTAVLEGRGGSAVRGTATVESVGSDSTRATIKVTGAKAGSEYAWHVHSGACGTSGQIFGDAKKYPAIKADRDGNATGSIVLPAAAPTSGDYSVTVHKSTSNLTPISCGTLKSGTQDGMSAGVGTDTVKAWPKDSMKPMPMPKDSTMPKDTLPRP
jgi:hypothetical protein